MAAVLFGIILIILMITVAIILYARRTAFYHPDRPMSGGYTMPKLLKEDGTEDPAFAFAKTMQEYPSEPVSIRSYDGCMLYGRYYHSADGAPLQILFHGYKGSPYIDCSGGTHLALKAGHNALVIDERSHGRSEGNIICFGIKERKDCLCWAQYAAKRFGADTPIILSGLSMGAATVLMAADLPMPSNVKGIIADCPYSSPKAILQKVSRDMKMPAKLLYPFIWLSAVLFGHFNLEESSAVESVQHTALPILLIHGEADDFVPHAMSVEIRDACKSPITFLSVPGAGHGHSYLTSPEVYEETVQHFLQTILY